MWAPVRLRGHQRHRRPDAYILLLMFQLAQQVAQLEYKPPVTLALMLANFAAFFSSFLPLELQRLVPSISQGCLQPHTVFGRGQWSRLIWSAFLHGDESHIYYNMTSLLWKGVQLERLLGSARFAALVGELLLLSHGLVLWGSWVLSQYIPEYRYLYASTCSVGFSAVLFALKVVLNHRSSTYSSVMGIQMPTKYLAWAELVLASAFNPRASFFGHLCGILAGFMHVWAAERVGHCPAVIGRSWRRLLRSTRQQQPRFAAAGAGQPPAAARERRQSAPRPAAAAGAVGDQAGGLGRQHVLGSGADRVLQGQSAAHQAQAVARTAEAGAAPPPLSAEELRLRRLARFT